MVDPTPQDPRIYPAAKALAEAMGAKKSWLMFVAEARATIDAADHHDPLRKKTP